MEENEAMSNMTEDLQLEVDSNIYAADWSSLERMAQLFKVEYAGKYKLLIVKHVTEPLEVEIGKKKRGQNRPLPQRCEKDTDRETIPWHQE